MTAKVVGGFDSHTLRQGEVAERTMALVLKTNVGIYPHRGFESHSHRTITYRSGWGSGMPIKEDFCMANPTLTAYDDKK